MPISLLHLHIRWIKLEENVEERGEKWSKPHVASLSLYALLELEKGLSSDVAVLDCDIQNLIQLTGQ